MPELPEVETVVRSLRPQLVGRRLGACRVRWQRTLGGVTEAEFTRGVDGACVRAVGRRAKWIVIELERGRKDAGAVCVHLRMTGRLQINAKDEPAGAWERVRIALDDGRVLRFLDPRKFGRMRFARELSTVVGDLGPEPLEGEFTPDWLGSALHRHRRVLKTLLLDQTFVAGLGNIYVDESLHRAGLHPQARSERIRAPQVAALWSAIREVLVAAIDREGSSFDGFYRTPEGRAGSYQHLFQVYGRTGQPCYRCDTPIRRVVVGQRGTYLCPACQPKPRVVRASHNGK